MDEFLKYINRVISHIILTLNRSHAYVHRLQCQRMKKQIATYVKKHPTECKLQIGSGRNRLEGWLNTDYNGPIYLDAGIKFEIKDNTFDYIFCEHLFEHLTLPQAHNMLSESYRILKPGGVLRIATPDYRFLREIYTNPNDELHQKYMQWLTKRFIQTDSVEPVFVISGFHTNWGHKVIYDFDTLARMTKQYGFSTRQCMVGVSEHPALCDIERHGTCIPTEFNLLETMILESTKL